MYPQNLTYIKNQEFSHYVRKGRVVVLNKFLSLNILISYLAYFPFSYLSYRGSLITDISHTPLKLVNFCYILFIW